jgi:hypothetical protein
MREAFTSMFSEKNFIRGMTDMKQSPEYERFVTQGKLFFADDAAASSQREEVFANRLLQRVPVLGKLIRGSERNFVHFLNKLRLDVMSDIVRGWATPRRAVAKPAPPVPLPVDPPAYRTHQYTVYSTV